MIELIKKHKYKLIAAAVVTAALAIAFIMGGGSDVQELPQPTPTAVAEAVSEEPYAEEEETESASDDERPTQSEEETARPEDEPDTEAEPERAEEPAQRERKVAVVTIPQATAVPESPAKQSAAVPDNIHTCTLSVRCDAVLGNSELKPEKAAIVPKNGIVLAEQTVTFEDGESVFDVLVREMKKNNIHIEFEFTPMYNSAYIEGIANLYEFDCGDLSGWRYKVNGKMPNYGCSSYILSDGDKVEWMYSCDL